MVYFSMKAPMVVFLHDFEGHLLYGRRVECFSSISEEFLERRIYTTF